MDMHRRVDAGQRVGLSRRSWQRPARSALLALVLTTGSAWTVPVAQAQGTSRQPERLDPPTVPPAQGKGAPWYFWLAALPIVGLVVGANLIPSKRGHQD